MLSKFVKQYKTYGEEYTHVSLDNGKYLIPDEKINEFYKILSKTDKYHIAEKHLDDYSYFKIDLDFKM